MFKIGYSKFIVSILIMVFALIGCKQDKSEADYDPDSLNVHQDSSKQPMENKTQNNEMSKIMEGMNKDMMDEKPSGIVDKDFAEMMSMHHQAAIKLAEVQLDKGNDSFLKSFAQNIKNKQAKEAEKLEDLGDNIKVPDSLSSTMQQHQSMMQNMMQNNMQSMNGMMQNMQASSSINNVDSSFALIMIQHHKSGVKMAEMEQKNGKNPQIKQIAANIISIQNKEIQQLQDWLKKKK